MRFRSLSRAALAACCLTGLASAGAATPQAGRGDTGPHPALAMPEDASATNDAARRTASRLKMALGACFPDPDEAAPQATAPIAFTLDGSGALVGIPAHRGPSPASPASRTLYLRALTALEACTPLPYRGPGTEVEAVISANGIDSLRLLPAPDRASAPATARSATTQATEAALDLTRSERREIQLRLRLLGFDPKGVDGVFGPNTRAALAEWQADRGLPASGYLDAAHLRRLKAQSKDRYAAYEPPAAAPDPPPVLRRVRVCRETGFLGLRVCRIEYRPL